MPPKEPNPILKLFVEVEKMTAALPKREEVVESMRKVLELLKETEVSLGKEIVSNKKEAQTALTTLRNDLKSLESSVSTMLAQLDSSQSSSLFTAIETLNSKIEAIQKQIPELPDYTDRFEGIESRLSEIRPDTAEEVRNKLELFVDEDEKLKIDAIGYLREELDKLKEEVKKKAVGGVGSGITNPIHWARHEAFTMDGVATDVTLTQVIGAEGNACIVRYQGQTLDMDTHYTTNGNKITLVGFTPASGDIISVTYWP